MNTHKKSFSKIIAISAAIFSVVYIALSVIYNLTISNIMYSTTLLPIFIELLVSLCDVCAYAVCFSVFIYSIYRLGTKSSMPIVLIYCGVLLFESLLNVTIHHIVFRTGWQLEGLLYVLMTWIFDVLFAFAAVLIAHLSLKDKKQDNVTFDGFFKKSNPLQSTALFVALLVSATKFFPRLIYDISYGAPRDLTDLLWMTAAYLSDFIIIVIVYFISNIILKKLWRSIGR